MTQFADYQKTPEAKEYGRPREVDVGRPTSSSATAISGAATLLDASVTTIDNLNKDDIDRKLFEEVNLKRQQNIAANASLLNPADEAGGMTFGYEGGVSADGQHRNYSTLPDAVASAERRMGMIAQANKMGKYDDVQYHGEMQEINQRITSQYPGYARYIQDRSAHWLGVNSANAQRSAIQTTLQQLAAGQKGDAEKWSNEMERDRTAFRKPDGSFDAEGYAYALNATDPTVRNGIRVHVARQKFIEHDIGLRTQQFALETASGNVQSARIEQHYSQVAGLETAKYVQTAKFNFAGKPDMTIQDINEYISKVRKAGGQVDPTVLRQLATVAAEFKDGLVKRLQEVELTRIGDSRDTITSLIKDKDKLTKIRNHYVTNTFGNIETQLGAGNFALATNMMNTVDGIKELQGFRVLNDETLGRFAIIAHTIPGQAGARIIDHELAKLGSSGLDNVSEIAKRIRMMQIMTGQNFGSLRTSLEHFNMISGLSPNTVLSPEQERARANYLKTEFDVVKNFITQKDAPAKSPELAIRAARVIIAPGSAELIGQFNKDQQMQIFSNLSSPDVAKKIKELSGSDTQLWKDYVAWNYYTFQRLYNTQIASLKQGVADTAGTNFKWTENGQIEFKNPRSMQQQAREGVLSPSATSIQAINNINTGLITLKTIADLNGDKLTPEFLKKFGINLELPPAPTQGTPAQGKRTQGAPNGSEGQPTVTFSPVGSAQATSGGLGLPNEFDESFDLVPDRGVNEPLEQGIRNRTRLADSGDSLTQVPEGSVSSTAGGETQALWPDPPRADGPSDIPARRPSQTFTEGLERIKNELGQMLDPETWVKVKEAYEANFRAVGRGMAGNPDVGSRSNPPRRRP